MFVFILLFAVTGVIRHRGPAGARLPQDNITQDIREILSTARLHTETN